MVIRHLSHLRAFSGEIGLCSIQLELFPILRP